MEALSALAILIVAQYGSKVPFFKEQIGDFFYFTKVPTWDITELYVPPIEGEDWIEKKYGF